MSHFIWSQTSKKKVAHTSSLCVFYFFWASGSDHPGLTFGASPGHRSRRGLAAGLACHRRRGTARAVPRSLMGFAPFGIWRCVRSLPSHKNTSGFFLTFFSVFNSEAMPRTPRRPPSTLRGKAYSTASRDPGVHKRSPVRFFLPRVCQLNLRYGGGCPPRPKRIASAAQRLKNFSAYYFGQIDAS